MAAAAAAAGYTIPVVPGVHSAVSAHQAAPSDSWLRNGLAFGNATMGTLEPSLDDRSTAVGRNECLSSSSGRYSRPFSQDRLVGDPSRLSWQTGVVDGITVAESDFGLQNYNLRAAVLDSSSAAAGKSSSSEGNETSMLMDVPGYVSAAERRRLLSSDLVVMSQFRLSSDTQGPSRSVHKHSIVLTSATSSPVASSQMAQMHASSAPHEPSPSSIWTDTSQHCGPSHDSFLYEPNAADSSGEAMRMVLDRMATYESSGVKDPRSCDSRSSLHSTETEYQMLPVAASPPGPRTVRQHSTGEVAAVQSAQSSMQDVPAYSTPPLREATGRERLQPASAHSSPPLTAVTMGSSCAAISRDWGSADGDIAAASATRRRSIKSGCSSIDSGSEDRRLAVASLAAPEDDRYVPVDPFSDTSCVSATGDCGETGPLESGYRRTSSALHGDCRPFERWQSRRRSFDSRSRSSDGMSSGTLSSTSSPPSFSTSGTTRTADVDHETSELDYGVVKPGIPVACRRSAGAAVTASAPAGTIRMPFVTAAVSAVPSAVSSRLASPSKRTTLATVGQLPVFAGRSRPVAAGGTATPTAVTTSAATAVQAVDSAALLTSQAPSLSTSEVVSSRLDHIEAMVMKALERQQLDAPSGELERSISDTIRRLRPDLSETKTTGVKGTAGVAVSPAAVSVSDSSIGLTKISSATATAAASAATTTVTSALAHTAASRTLSKTPVSDSRRTSASLPSSKAGGDQTSDITNDTVQKSCVQPLKDLSLNLSLLPDRTLPTFSAFSSAKDFLSEQLKCRAGERTPGRNNLPRPADEELAFSSLSDQENLPASDQDTHASDISVSAGIGSLMHLQPYRLSGKKAFTYVTPSHAATTDDALSMATTVESTHPDSDDTRPPLLPAEVLGSRTEPAHRTPGIYGTRRPRLVDDEPMHGKPLAAGDRLAQQKLAQQPPSRCPLRTVRDSSADGNVAIGLSQALTTEEAMPVTETLAPAATPAPATLAPSATSCCTATSCSTATSAYVTGPSPSSQHQVLAAHLGSFDYAQQLRERANSLLRITEQLGNGFDIGGESARAAGDAPSRAENQLPGDSNPRPDSTDRRVLVSGNQQHDRDERFERASIARSRSIDEATRTSHIPPSRCGSGRVALHQDEAADRLDTARKQARQQVLSSAAKATTLRDTKAAHSERTVSAIPSYSRRSPVAVSRATQAATRLPGERHSQCANAERLHTHQPPLANDQLPTSVDCSPPPNGAVAATGRRATALERLSDRRTSPSSQRQAASAPATSDVNKPVLCATGMRRMPSLSSSPSARHLSDGRGRNSRAGGVRSSSTSPSPSSRASRQLPLERSPDASRRPSPRSRSISRYGDIAIGSSSGLPGDKAQQPSTTTTSTLRSKLTDVIKDRQLTYRVLIEELTNAEDIRKRTLLNQAWSEANQKRNDENSLSDEKLQRLCDLLRNPLRHLITKSKGDGTRRPSCSPDRERAPARHLEAVRSTVLRQKTATLPTTSVTDHVAYPVHERKVVLRDTSTSPTRERNLECHVNNHYIKDRDFGHTCTDGYGRGESTPAAVSASSALATYGAGTNLVADRICKSPTYGKQDKCPNPASAPPLSAKAASAEVGQPEEMLPLRVDAEKLLSRLPVAAPTGSTAVRRPVSSGDGDARQARDSVMWYQPFSQKEAEASTFENARQHFSEDRGCSWFVALGQPKPWKRLPIERHANRVGQEPWFPVATKVDFGAGSTSARRRHGNTELGPLVSAAERRVLRELDFARHDAASRNDRAMAADVTAESRCRILPDEPKAKGTLQEAFERRKQAFISRSRERLRRVALRSEERAINCLHDAERERLFGLRAPLTAAPGEKLPGRYGSAATAAAAGVARASSFRHPKQRDLACFTEGRFERSSRHRAPPKRMAPISKHEMYERTRRMCTELPEKQYRDLAVRRRQECTVHRSRVRIFNKKVLHSVLRKAHVLKKTRR